MTVCHRRPRVYSAAWLVGERVLLLDQGPLRGLVLIRAGRIETHRVLEPLGPIVHAIRDFSFFDPIFEPTRLIRHMRLLLLQELYLPPCRRPFGSVFLPTVVWGDASLYIKNHNLSRQMRELLFFILK